MAEEKKKGFFSFLRFGKKKEVDIFQEEQVQSPLRTIISNFLHNRIAMTGLIVFLAIFVFVMIGPHIWILDLGYEDNTQVNVAPGLDMMSYPRALVNEGVQKIAVGNTFSVGLSKEGHVYTWGKTKITEVVDIREIPEEVKKATIIDIAAGQDHVVAVDDKGKVYVWGNTRQGQNKVPSEMMQLENGDRIKQMSAGYQASVAVTEQGKLFVWGNANIFDAKINSAVKEKLIEKAVCTSYAYIVLTKDGQVLYPGFESNAFSNIPESLSSGVVDIAASSQTVAALKADGTVVVWGNSSNGEDLLPDFPSKIINIEGGRLHYSALMENGDVISWGSNKNGQINLPASVNSGEKLVNVFVGNNQNYGITESGKIKTWGHVGYLMGTDNLGRDILTRLVNGGRMTMTVGAVSVAISLVIGVVFGSLAGYFGGKVDMIIMRVSEVVGGLPFLPFAMILSAIVQATMNQTQRIYMIMVVLGVLSWPGLCRLVRAQILAAREEEFVTAAKAMGVEELQIVFKHILPNVLSIIVVNATLDFATCMLTESSLSYLGFGVAPPQPTWGNMLTGANNSVVIQQYWWRWVFPSAIFGLCTICINTIGDGLRDAIDPKSDRQR